MYGLLLIPAAVQAAPLSLWKIEHDQAVVYLVGSVHVLKADDYPLPAAFQMAFDAAQITVFEVDLDKTSEPEVARFLVDEGATNLRIGYPITFYRLALLHYAGILILRTSLSNNTNK